ncbi:hypothetical protein EC973_003403 [Apophysomyces ossiformis]|uniref:Uncharacterized protein n=1 Tax=Apophysomyces ossiformis TaxID=679940 RepID=A0A8H7ERR4_9FUNG|nr:hypothetical protein EC973_003403 [Apophysomyces ossiformis]
MATGSDYSNPPVDEENPLCSSVINSYGAANSTFTSNEQNTIIDHCPPKETCSQLAKHPKPHLHKKQSRSKLANLLASRSGSPTEETDLDMVLPALDPQAQEVIASLPSQRSIDQFLLRRAHVNLSTIRSKYRAARKHARDEHTEVYSVISNIKQYLNYDTYISRIKKILFSNHMIVLFVRLDLLVDLLFCLAYLVEMKQESDVNLDPPWLYKWRSYDLWYD